MEGKIIYTQSVTPRNLDTIIYQLVARETMAGRGGLQVMRDSVALSRNAGHFSHEMAERRSGVESGREAVASRRGVEEERREESRRAEGPRVIELARYRVPGK